MATPCQHPIKLLFVFDPSIKAAQKDFIILMHKFRGDLSKALEAQQASPLGYGLGFKPIEILALIQMPSIVEQAESYCTDPSSLLPLSAKTRESKT
jgi:hypothetical protein